MLRTVLTRRWAGFLLLAVVFATACVFLGRWQYGRHVERLAQRDLVDSHVSAAPVPLASALPRGVTGLEQSREWTRVTFTGTYRPQQQLMVRNRPQNVVYGYEVLVPLVLPSGDAVLVDRGWVKNAERADVVPTVPGAPSTPVTVTGWLRPGEEQTGEGLPTGQLASINVAQAARATGLELRPAYVLLESEDDGSGAPPPRPQALLAPDTSLGPHLAYAIQWWGAAPVGFILVFIYARREARDAAAAGGGPRPPRPKKVRIWDEEDA